MLLQPTISSRRSSRKSEFVNVACGYMLFSKGPPCHRCGGVRMKGRPHQTGSLTPSPAEKLPFQTWLVFCSCKEMCAAASSLRRSLIVLFSLMTHPGLLSGLQGLRSSSPASFLKIALTWRDWWSCQNWKMCDFKSRAEPERQLLVL